MSPTAKNLLSTALDLEAEDRLEIVEALIVSLHHPTERPPFDDSWREVVRRRSAELASGLVTPVPWSEKCGRRPVAEVRFHPEEQAEHQTALACGRRGVAGKIVPFPISTPVEVPNDPNGRSGRRCGRSGPVTR